MTKTWLITGCSTGFGRLLAQAALDRGDQVVATARDPATLADIAKGLSQDGGNDGARCDEARSRR
jgi:NAD(P)-dependent dehydrogenase (short-subunit alcohol dehydrogenase family)